MVAVAQGLEARLRVASSAGSFGPLAAIGVGPASATPSVGSSTPHATGGGVGGGGESIFATVTGLASLLGMLLTQRPARATTLFQQGAASSLPVLSHVPSSTAAAAFEGGDGLGEAAVAVGFDAVAFVPWS